MSHMDVEMGACGKGDFLVAWVASSHCHCWNVVSLAHVQTSKRTASALMKAVASVPRACTTVVACKILIIVLGLSSAVASMTHVASQMASTVTSCCRKEGGVRLTPYWKSVRGSEPVLFFCFWLEIGTDKKGQTNHAIANSMERVFKDCWAVRKQWHEERKGDKTGDRFHE